MRALAGTAALGVVLVFSLVDLPASHESPFSSPVEVGGQVTSLILRDLAGVPLSLDELFDPPDREPAVAVVLVYWSARCPVSRAYESRLATLSQDYAARGPVRWALVDPNDDEGSREIQTALGLTLPVLRDRGAGFAARLGIRTTPHALVIDRNRTLAYAGAIDSNLFGDPDRREDYLAAALESVLSGQLPDPATTRSFGASIRRPPTDAEHASSELEAANRL
jgi:hypothetical protein